MADNWTLVPANQTQPVGQSDQWSGGSIFLTFNWLIAARFFQIFGALSSGLGTMIYMYVLIAVLVKIYRELRTKPTTIRFCDSYYAIVVSMTIADLVESVKYFIAIYLFFVPPVADWHLALVLRMFTVQDTFWYTLGFHKVLTALYRLVVTWVPQKLGCWFSPVKTTVFITACWLVAFGLNLPAIVRPGLNPRYAWRPLNCSLGWDIGQSTAINLYRQINYVEYANLIVCALVYLAVAAKFKSRNIRTNRTAMDIRESRRTIEQLLVYTIYLMIILLQHCSRNVRISDLGSCVYQYIIAVLTTYYFFASGVVYLVVNADIRMACVQLVRPKQERSQVTLQAMSTAVSAAGRFRNLLKRNNAVGQANNVAHSVSSAATTLQAAAKFGRRLAATSKSQFDEVGMTSAERPVPAKVGLAKSDHNVADVSTAAQPTRLMSAATALRVVARLGRRAKRHAVAQQRDHGESASHNEGQSESQSRSQSFRKLSFVVGAASRFRTPLRRPIDSPVVEESAELDTSVKT